MTAYWRKATALCATLLLMGLGGTACRAEAPAVDISGFGDLVYVSPQAEGEPGDFGIGQVEIGLEATPDELVAFSAAIAYDPERSVFDLGAFALDFHLFGSEGEHLRPLAGVAHSGVMVGQFDVPFGVDWYVYPSIDRKLVSAPLVVENTHDGWNDQGIQAYVEQGLVNGMLYVVNGFAADGTETALSAGGRLEIQPHAMLRIGGSYAGFFSDEPALHMALLGGDALLSYANLEVKGEVIVHQRDKHRSESVTNTGYYVQARYRYAPLFIVGRYGGYHPDDTDGVQRLSAGFGWVPFENVELRFEYQWNSESDDDVMFFQSVAAF